MEEPSAAQALHVAIIMDGNGRWAAARGWPRTEGHRRGAEAVRRTVEAASRLGVGTLTLYAFSADNWKRPAEEIGTLMALFRRYLRVERRRLVATGIRLSVIGRRDRLSRPVLDAIDGAEAATAAGRSLHLRLAVDYSARDAILRALETAPYETPPEAFPRRLARAYGPSTEAPDVDLLIRTGGEQRLSDFLLWEVAYAELRFTQGMWPDFGPDDLAEALADFRRRDRRFGGLSGAAPPASASA